MSDIYTTTDEWLGIGPSRELAALRASHERLVKALDGIYSDWATSSVPSRFMRLFAERAAEVDAALSAARLLTAGEGGCNHFAHGATYRGATAFCNACGQALWR